MQVVLYEIIAYNRCNEIFKATHISSWGGNIILMVPRKSKLFEGTLFETKQIQLILSLSMK